VDIVKGIAVINNNTCTNCGLCIENCPQDAIRNIIEEFTIAIGTDDKIKIKANDHVGMSRHFQIWKYSNNNFTLDETRENAKYIEDETKLHGDPGKAKATASVLKNVDVLVGKMMGPNIERLKHKFVPAIIRAETIQDGLEIIKNNINEIAEEKEKEGLNRHGIVLN
jgi:predicted Fe-Mo cluster-binding NifX family protein